jgi:hypothetical protein
MKITATKIINELQENYGWASVEPQLIKDVIKIIDSKLKYHKGISIKK